jgi:hypothetical protein
MFLAILVFLFYAAWGVLSLVCQGNHPTIKRIKSRDELGLIPNYKFFCPNPSRTDFHLYYRQSLTPDEFSDWQEIGIHRRSLAFAFLWNPGKRDRKIFTSTIKAILNKYQRKPHKTKGPVYEFFLRHVLNQASLKGKPVQFKITTRQDLSYHPEEAVVFTSSLHQWPA